jgi:Family of unknown function (DUF6134)
MRKVAGIVAMLLLAAEAPASAETLRYAIMRNGDQIGTHTVEITRTGSDTSVSLATNLVVKVLFITAYHFQHTDSERWANGHLVSLKSSTDNNGTRHNVSVVTKPSGLELDADGKMSQLDRNIVTGSLWNADILHHMQFLDAQDGQTLPLTVIDDGTDDVMVGGHPLKAHHYTLKSRYSQDVWFDDHQRLVQVKIVGTDGSIISYALI